ncbi:hypothetical protein IFM89_015889 [Coptis chinensis]|uniref:LEC14B homolog n=1 Tax=Coptis chinensis TaxID=261450 RepID=A0A835LRC0_9MAGN|nr:hypothetical protein IFM89_015889 [Coptis chinensis]
MVNIIPFHMPLTDSEEEDNYEMGFAMSRLGVEEEEKEEFFQCDEASSINIMPNKTRVYIDNDIHQITKLGTKPDEHLRRVLPGERVSPSVSTVRMLAGREFNYSGKGRFSFADCRHVVSRYLPVYGPWEIDRFNTRAYVSQFSADGSLLVAGSQGSHIKIYNVEKDWKVQKDILAKSLRWTVTDTSLSPDQRYLVYASMSPFVHIVDIGSATKESHANVTSDVNTVCFADETGHLIYSGSDDNLCKVWDRRCIGKGKPAGVLMGHLEGITFIDSRGDGRYFISNGKDQTIKLWDIRKMPSNASSSSSSSSSSGMQFRNYEWDYRWMEYPPRARNMKHPCDQSLSTYRGHSVLRTLIRCYFSPAYSTGQKYIYTGSNDGCVYIYDLVSGNQVARLDHHSQTVRDCSWHPFNPMLVSCSWDGVIARGEFPGTGEKVRRKRIRRKYEN